MPKESPTSQSDTTEQKTNIFAAVNKPTSFFKKLFLFFKREITLILGSKPQPGDTMQQNHHCRRGGAEVFLFFIFFFKKPALCQNLPLHFIPCF